MERNDNITTKIRNKPNNFLTTYELEDTLTLGTISVNYKLV